MSEEKKWVFHFYWLKWHDQRWAKVNFVYKYTDEQIAWIYNSLRKSWFSPSEDDPWRFKFHDIKYLEHQKIIYGYFVHYYNEHVKTIENPNGKDVLSSEWYLFLYFVEDNRIVLQHKKWIWDKPWIWEIRDKFINYYKVILLEEWLPSPYSWEKEELWRDRREFIEVFFNKKNRITYLEVEKFDKLNLQAQKIENSNYKFSYFNPIFDEWDTAIKTEDYQIEHLKSLRAEAEEWKTLWKVPACRIAAASATNFKKMKFFPEEKYEEEIYIEKWASSVESEIDSETEISDAYLNNVISLIQSFVRWRKAKTEWEFYSDSQTNIFND